MGGNLRTCLFLGVACDKDTSDCLWGRGAIRGHVRLFLEQRCKQGDMSVCFPGRRGNKGTSLFVSAGSVKQGDTSVCFWGRRRTWGHVYLFPGQRVLADSAQEMLHSLESKKNI